MKTSRKAGCYIFAALGCPKIILLAALLFALPCCARKTLTIVVPEGGTPEEQAPVIINSALSVLKGLDEDPSDIRVVFQRPGSAPAPEKEERAF